MYDGLESVLVVRRSFYLSLFEILSERGKGEKLSDLSENGADIYMQQSAVKGLKEVSLYISKPHFPTALTMRLCSMSYSVYSNLCCCSYQKKCC